MDQDTLAPTTRGIPLTPLGMATTVGIMADLTMAARIAGRLTNQRGAHLCLVTHCHIIPATGDRTRQAAGTKIPLCAAVLPRVRSHTARSFEPPLLQLPCCRLLRRYAMRRTAGR